MKSPYDVVAPAREATFARLSQRFFYGWTMVAVALVVMMATGPGQSHLIGLFFDPLSESLGLSRTSVALSYGSATLVAALLLPKMGRVMDRLGPVELAIWAGLLFGLAAFAFSAASSWLYIAVGFGLLRFLGQGTLMLSCVNIVSQWFDTRRGFALGLMMLGFPVSMALHPPLAQWLIDTVGWREAWMWLGASTWLLILPPLLLLGFSHPEPLGLHPDGRTTEQQAAQPGELWGYTRAEALRSPTFYIVTIGLFSMSMLVTSLHVENKAVLVAHGLDAQTATLMFTVTGVTAAISMPIIGRMLDRFPSHRMFAGGLLAAAASVIAVTFVGSVPTAIAYAVVFGLNNGVTMTYFGYFWPRYFGRKHLGSIQGIGQMVAVIGASLGPLPLAYAIDNLGSYDGMLRALALFPITMAVVAATFLKAPERPA